MKNERWRSGARLLALVVALPLVWGCFKYKEALTLNPGGDGSITITASIPEDVAGRYRDAAKITGQVPPPVSKGVITQMMLGSDHVQLEKCDVELRDGAWQYDIKVTFDRIQSLSEVRFFKERAMSSEYLGGMRLKFSETITPNLLDMAKDAAKTLPNDPYAPQLLAVADSDDFHKDTDDSTMTYEVTLPGTEPNVEGLGQVQTKRTENPTSVSWDFKMGELQQKGTTPPALALTVSLPRELGAMSIVITLLIFSFLGIVIPAIRLLVMKKRRAA